MNILLVDDQQIERELIKEALKFSQSPVAITEVNNAKDGLSVLQRNRFDVVLLDYQMPSMSGLELLLEIQSLKLKTNSTYIVISNDRDEELMVSFINAGAHDFLLKDEITTTQLIRSIKQSQKRLELERELQDSFNQVKSLAERDQLTGLSNRHHFEVMVNSLLLNTRGLNGFIAIMLLDLDGFKMINDSLGHNSGDLVLKELAHRFKSKFRESQLIARLGGDEFAFVFTGITKASAAYRIANRILSSFKKPLTIEDQQLVCSGSVGISLNLDSKLTLEELIKRADIAMYQAKNLGKSQACLYEEKMESEFFRSYLIENELKDAFEKEEFELHFQPIFDCESRTLSSLEALVRWPSGKTTQNPQEFIKVAEESRLIEALGRWIIKKAFTCFSHIMSVSMSSNISLSINLSPLQLHDLNLTKFISEHAKQKGIDLKSITIEVTETALLENSCSTKDTIHSIKSLGCKIALDDFGTGYSSISHLINYPIDIVKFDKSLINRILEDKTAFLMLKGLTSMLSSIGIETVAEGVELAQQRELCESINITRIQGYLLSKPLCLTDCLALFTGSKLNS